MSRALWGGFLVALAPCLLSYFISGNVATFLAPHFTVDQIPDLDGDIALVTGPTLGGTSIPITIANKRRRLCVTGSLPQQASVTSRLSSSQGKELM